MAIVTVSRELAALGDETAQALAELLDYRLVDKDTLEERIKSYGVTSAKFHQYDEKKPSFWASLSRDRDDYLHFLKSAILEEAEQESAVFIGRGAGLILNGVPGVFSVFLVASLDVRIERVKSYFHCDDKRARQIIDKNDHDREGFHRYFFDTDWKNSANYHLVMNTGYLHPYLCAELVKCMWVKSMTEESEAQAKTGVADMALAQRIRHHILYQKGLSIHFLEITVSNRQVILHGVANAHSTIEAAVSFAREIAGDYIIQPEIQVVQDYSVMP